MSYLEQVKADVEQYTQDNENYFDFSDYNTPDDFAEDLNDKLFCEDSVTGNASGSYTFNSYEAREHVLEDIGMYSIAVDTTHMNNVFRHL